MLYLVFNTYPALFNARRSQSNPIELQSFEWLRLGSVIELNWTHPTILPIEHNRTLGNQTLKQSNIIIKHCIQQSNVKPVSSGFKQKALCSNKLRLHFQTQVHKDVTELMRDPGNEVGHRGRKTQTSFWKWWLKATMSAHFHCQCLWKVYFSEEKGISSSVGNWRWPRPTWTFATWTDACAYTFPSTNCEFIDFKLLKR